MSRPPPVHLDREPQLGAGIALAMKKLEGSDRRVYVLMGDGESAEGSIWEAAQFASFHGVANLCFTIDVNRLGRSQPTMLRHDMKRYQSRWESFGWQALVVNGHSIPDLLAAYETARNTTNRPTIVLAETIKGKGLTGIEGLENWHGKTLDRNMAAKVVANLEKQLTGAESRWNANLPSSRVEAPNKLAPPTVGKPPYQIGGKEVATRKGFGDGLAALTQAAPFTVVLDADVENSTYTEEAQKVAPDRLFETYIAEQNMIGVAMGLSSRHYVPIASTFACFFTRAYDFIRMAAIGGSNIKLVGTHAGISIGEDGPSQMGLEDLAMMCAEPNYTVLYPSDGTSAFQATVLIGRHKGPCYLRIGRPAAPILYGPDEQFEVGKCKVLRSSDLDMAVVVAAGVTVFEALSAYDELAKEGITVRVIDLFSVQPIDREALAEAARATGGKVITVEDHYEHGGLGDAVMAALSDQNVGVRKLAVRGVAHSGQPKELLDRFGISARHIVDAVKQQLA